MAKQVSKGGKNWPASFQASNERESISCSNRAVIYERGSGKAWISSKLLCLSLMELWCEKREVSLGTKHWKIKGVLIRILT